MRHTKGFILIIVIGLLGSLGMLAVALVSGSNTAKQLARQQIFRSHLKTLSRSGIEHALQKQYNAILVDIRNIPLDDAIVMGHFDPGVDGYNVQTRELSGTLFLNDGIHAGEMENVTFPIQPILDSGGATYIPGGYRSNAVDPWPEDPDDPSKSVMDISAFINLRMRRLLNAYGDAHRFVDQIGWPQHILGNADSSAFGTKFPFTSTAAGPRYRPMPGIHYNTQATLTDLTEVAANSSGLGDRLLASRPARGYRQLSDVHSLINTWGAQHLSTAYLNGKPFYDHVSVDLSVNAAEDRTLLRMTRELGPDDDGDGFADYDGDPRNSRVNMMPLDTNPPDLTDLWRPHAAHLININSASNLVRAAIFYAPANISFVCEGILADVIGRSPGKETYAWTSTTPTLGVGGPVFRTGRLKENGWPGDPAAPPTDYDQHVQTRRLMSLRDALILSKNWQHAATVASTTTSSITIDDVYDFNAMKVRMNKIFEHDDLKIPESERGGTAGDQLDVGLMRKNVGNAHFEGRFIEAVLPYILRPGRRLPGWMQAPWPLLSPYVQEGGGLATTTSLPPVFPEKDLALRSVEDFVFRAPIPKICFLPNGLYRFSAHATFDIAGNLHKHQTHVVSELFRTRTWRTQKDFYEMTDLDQSTSQLMIGPEPRRVVSSDALGVVGLMPHNEQPPRYDMPYMAYLSFDRSLQADANSNFLPKNPAADTEIDPPTESSVVEVPPVPYPNLQQGYIFVSGLETPFDQNVLDALRNTSRPPGRTWKVPADGEQFFITAGWPSTMVDFILGSADPNYDPNYSWDRKLWIMLDYFHMPFETMWPTTWKDGVPPQYNPGNNSILQNSQLEGDDVSLFQNGSTGSDLNPFGGINLSSRGHGARVPGMCHDSLYFRPTDLLDKLSTSPKSPGEVFDKMTISFWYRSPSGYRWSEDEKTLVNMSLWENLQVQPDAGYDDGKNTPPLSPAPNLPGVATLQTQYRSTQLHVKLKGVSGGSSNFWRILLNVGTTPGGTFDTLTTPTWANDYTLPQYPFPNVSGPPQSDPLYNSLLSQHPRLHKFWPVLNYAAWFTGFTEDIGGTTFTAVPGRDTYENQPGSWMRFSLTWHTSAFQEVFNRFKIYQRHGNWNNVKNALIVPNTYNPHMIISIGETLFNKHADLSTWGSYPYSGSTIPWTLMDDSTYPIQRLNSTIDNLIIAAGTDNGFTQIGQGHHNQIIEHTGYRNLRYDISSTNEPTWLVHPPNIPEQARVLAASAEIYDPPYLHQWGTNIFDGWKYPRIDTDVLDNGIPLTPFATPVNPAPFNNIATYSPGRVLYNGDAISDPSTLRLRFIWRNISPVGQDVLFADLYEAEIRAIPYIKSVSLKTIDGTPRILNWSEN